MSDHHHAAANPPLQSQPRHRHISPSTLPALISLFLLLAAAALSLAATLTLIRSIETEFEIDSFRVSSFNISGGSWIAILSFNHSELESESDRGEVAYEARSWIYSRSGFVAVDSLAMSCGGGELALKSNFPAHFEEEAAADGGILILDLLIEANATRKGSGTASYLTIECCDLVIEFSGGLSLGVLSGDGGNACGVQIYATKSGALKGVRPRFNTRRRHVYSFRSTLVDSITNLGL